MNPNNTIIDLTTPPGSPEYTDTTPVPSPRSPYSDSPPASPQYSEVQSFDDWKLEQLDLEKKRKYAEEKNGAGRKKRIVLKEAEIEEEKARELITNNVAWFKDPNRGKIFVEVTDSSDEEEEGDYWLCQHIRNKKEIKKFFF